MCRGKRANAVALPQRSDKFHKLAEFMKQNAAGWHKRSEDYEPSLVVIGSNVNLYFMNDLLVMSYNGGEYSRNVAPDSYSFLVCGTR